MDIIEERNHWRQQFDEGKEPTTPWLLDYRRNRDSNLWRSSRPLEQLCEYILYLEDKISKKESQNVVEDDLVSRCVNSAYILGVVHGGLTNILEAMCDEPTYFGGEIHQATGRLYEFLTDKVNELCYGREDNE